MYEEADPNYSASPLVSGFPGSLVIAGICGLWMGYWCIRKN